MDFGKKKISTNSNKELTKNEFQVVLKTKYPSSELLQQPCFEDYIRHIDTYDKIYEKVNISLAFSGIVLIVILNTSDISLLMKMWGISSKSEFFLMLTLLFCSTVSWVCMVWAVIQLLLLMRSKQMTVFDSIAVRNDEIYRWSPDEAALWLIDKYTFAVFELRNVISEKQKKYDSAVIKIVISILAFAIVLLIG